LRAARAILSQLKLNIKGKINVHNKRK